MRGADLHPKDHSIQLFTDPSNEVLQRVCFQMGKRATHKCSRVEGCFPGPLKLQGPVSEPKIASCNGQLNSGSLHKQTKRNSLSRDVRTPVEDHDMVPSLSHNIESHTRWV